MSNVAQSGPVTAPGTLNAALEAARSPAISSREMKEHLLETRAALTGEKIDHRSREPEVIEGKLPMLHALLTEVAENQFEAANHSFAIMQSIQS